MIRRPLLTIAITSFLVSLSLFIGIMTNENVQASLFGKPLPTTQGLILPSIVRVEVSEAAEVSDEAIIAKSGDWSYCDYEAPEASTFEVEWVSTSVPDGIEGGDAFEVVLTFMNKSNTRLFAEGSGCENGAVLNLGTQYAQDRASLFGGDELALSGWTSASRVAMSESFVDAGESFTVRFQSLAPEGDNIYREFFQPLIEGQAWIGSIVPVTISVGNPTETMVDDMNYVSHASVDAASLTGLQRNLEINLTEQVMHAKFGNLSVWQMPTSTGAWDTPTPTGSYQIFQKQELRVGGKSPHYRMPYWQFWDSRGYGIHALPYLGSTQGGYFWEEAREHIGSPVSHGCVRTLPEDAEKLYGFTTIGTPMVIHR